MLRFRLHQLHSPSLGRYLLPLPKLAPSHVEFLTENLKSRSFSVVTRGRTGKTIASRGPRRIAIDGGLGLATSSLDMLDALAPAVAALLSSQVVRSHGADRDVSDFYYSWSSSSRSTTLKFFPRLEALRTWTCLRRDGLSGLTPDEEVALQRAMQRAPRSSRVECVTDRPRGGSRPLQLGRRIYYLSSLPPAEFLSSLRSIASEGTNPACYLPRNSILRLPAGASQTRISAQELGEWCLR